MTNEEIALTQPKGTRFVKNEVTVLGGQYSGVMNSGRSVTLSGDGVVQVPIHYELGSDSKQTATLGDGWVDNGGDSYTATDATSSLSDLSSTSNADILVNYTISNYSAGDLNGHAADGTYEEWLKTEELVGNGFSGDVLINSVLPVESVNGSVTYFDASQKEFIQVTHDGVGSTEELVVDGAFDDPTKWDENAPEIVVEDGVGKFLGNIEANYRRLTNINTVDFITTKRYKISLDVLNFVEDGCYVRIPFNTCCNTLAQNGHYEEYGYPDTDYLNQGIAIANNNTDANLQVDNVSLKEVLPLSTTYDLKDGEYGAIIKLHTNSFSQEDIDALNAEPELLIDWYFGNRTIPSGIVKGADDKVYYPVDGVYLELSYSEGPNLLTNGTFDTDTNGWDAVNSIISSVDGQLRVQPDIGVPHNFPAAKQIVQDTTILGTKYIWWSETKTSTTGKLETFVELIGDSSSGIINRPIGTLTKLNTNYMRVFTAKGEGELSAINKCAEATVEEDYAEFDNVVLKQLFSEYIPVEGAYTYNTRLNYGIQDMRLELNDAGVPTSVITSKVNTNGEINTGFKLYAADEYTIEESLTIDSETHTWAWTSAGKVFKGGTEVGTYTVPADGTSLVLGDTTLDGQTITERHQTRVWTYIPHEYA